MLTRIKRFILSHEPFKPAHMGNWIRELYFSHYVKKYIHGRDFSIRDILDGGCAQGHYARTVARMFPGANILAVDIKERKEWVSNIPPNVVFRRRDLLLLDETESRDFIYSVDVIEHIIGNEKVLRNFFRALRPGGFLYLAVPCEETQQFVFPRSFFGDLYAWADIEHVGEMRRVKDLTRLLEEIGYEIELSRSTFTFFGHLTWETEYLLHRRLGVWGRRLNAALMPLFKLCGFLDLLFPLGEGNNLIIARKNMTIGK